MSDEKAKCTKAWHDAFGNDYDSCQQCFIRDGGMLGEPNPFLMMPEELKKRLDERAKDPANWKLEELRDEYGKLVVKLALARRIIGSFEDGSGRGLRALAELDIP